VPDDQVDVYSDGVSLAVGTTGTDSQVTCLKHKTKNFFWNGDGGYFSYLAGNNVAPAAYPFRLTSANLPTPKPYSGSLQVYNSTFMANVLAWAIKQAEFAGINTP
jgi:hypothetical protein